MPSCSRSGCRLSPERLMLSDEAGTWLTFEEFAARTAGTAAALRSLGVNEGSTVAWQLPNTADALLVFMALSCLAPARVDFSQVSGRGSSRQS